jgi:nucleoside-diphosphate-sugar epimerase
VPPPAASTTALELAPRIGEKLRPGVPFRYVSDPAYSYDEQKRVPDTSKAERVLGYRPTTSLSEMLDLVIPWIKQQVEYGNI